MTNAIPSLEASTVGQRTLEIFADTGNINDWIFSRFAEHVRGDVLEIGSGLGNMSRLILPRARSVTLTDIEAEYVANLRSAYDNDPRVTVALYDLEKEPPPGVDGRTFDTIVAVNVIEHLRDDFAAVKRLADRLRPGGRLCIYVPACPIAFGSLDTALGHFRRYTPVSLGDLLERAGLLHDPIRYINMLGLFGWILNGRVLNRRVLSGAQVRLFDRLVPLLRCEDWARPPLGLGITTCAHRPDR